LTKEGTDATVGGGGFAAFAGARGPLVIIGLALERALFAIAKLARRDARTFSALIGKHLVCNGQPGETDGVEESEEKYKDYEQRLLFIRDSAKEFIGQIKAQKEAIHQDTSLSNDEKAEKLRKKTKAIANINRTKS